MEWRTWVSLCFRSQTNDYYIDLILVIGAGDGDRTRDVQLGKLAFYH